MVFCTILPSASFFAAISYQDHGWSLLFYPWLLPGAAVVTLGDPEASSMIIYQGPGSDIGWDWRNLFETPWLKKSPIPSKTSITSSLVGGPPNAPTGLLKPFLPKKKIMDIEANFLKLILPERYTGGT